MVTGFLWSISTSTSFGPTIQSSLASHSAPVLGIRIYFPCLPGMHFLCCVPCAVAFTGICFALL